MDISQLRIMNAAGWCKDVGTVRKLAKTPVSEITVGSITRDPRLGNEGNVFWQSPDGVYALNSLGLPNPGLEKYRRLLPEMCTIADDAGKELRVSIAGFSPKEYAELALTVAQHAGIIELNLGCPNVWGADGQKPIAAFSTELTANIIHHVAESLQDMGNDKPRIALKLSPYSDPMQMDRIIAAIQSERLFIDEVVTSNTFPNAFAWDEEKTAITPGGGFAGMSGKAMKGIALGQAARLRTAFHHHGITVIGAGGTTTGGDLLDFMRLGVMSVQVGTHYFLNGEKVFSELLQECAELAE